MSDTPTRLAENMRRLAGLVDENLRALCSHCPSDVPPRLWDSVTYSLLAGGKRLRPVLCLAAAEMLSVPPARVMPMALALEMIHTASLIHDDLPAMDDDTLRRGKPTNHVLFGESLAILAGDGLLVWGFSHPLKELVRLGNDPSDVIDALRVFADAAGIAGICGGQVLDTDPESRSTEVDFVRRIAGQKTAVLIQASVLSGAILAHGDPEVRSAIGEYGMHLGIAFQVVDDILDVTSSAEELGKTPGKDAEQGKRTFVASYGLEGAKKIAQSESEKAIEALSRCGDDIWFLKDLATHLTHRHH